MRDGEDAEEIGNGLRLECLGALSAVHGGVRTQRTFWHFLSVTDRFW